MSKRDSEKVKAHYLVRMALRKEIIKKDDQCFICGKITKRLSSHHNDYDKPLHVFWLCQKHHSMIHRLLRYMERIKLT